ncbi:hypothetical protein ACNTMW_09785 [Planosporangium sp. 12N6]|uniref:hypothetical protein n=1 Tax=Planosporangium spinosum TaxID=3402278 RepID=UPI003CE9478D
MTDPHHSGSAGEPTTATDVEHRGPVDQDRAAAGLAGRIPATLVLAVLAVAWLAATLWSVHGTLAGSTGIQSISQAALALPFVVTASLVAGAAIGLLGADLLGTRVPRPLAGLAGGLVTGLVVAGLVLAGYGTTSSLIVLAAGVGAASLLGGAISALPRPAVVGAAVAGALAWLLLGLMEGAFYSRLLKIFGAGSSTASRVDASHRLALTAAVVGGLLAGIVAYRYLRRRARDPRWPEFLVAGAGPGLLLLVADLVALAAGTRLRALAAASSEADRAALYWSSNVGISTAMVVLFVGAIVATIAFGRTLGPADAGLTAQPAEADRDQTS